MTLEIYIKAIFWLIICACAFIVFCGIVFICLNIYANFDRAKMNELQNTCVYRANRIDELTHQNELLKDELKNLKDTGGNNRF